MKYPIITTAVAALALSACGQPQKSETQTNAVNGAAKAETGQTYSGTGKVTAVAGNQVTIQHGPIEGIGWPAMTMSFTDRDGLREGIQAGDQVDFSFRQDGGTFVLTSLRKR